MASIHCGFDVAQGTSRDLSLTINLVVISKLSKIKFLKQSTPCFTSIAVFKQKGQK
jgi:hypothetical protein